MIGKMKAGDVSQPTAFTGDQGKERRQARIFKINGRNRIESNLNDDYSSKISQAALEEKKGTGSG